MIGEPLVMFSSLHRVHMHVKTFLADLKDRQCNIYYPNFDMIIQPLY